jgi:hypothetical protein
VVGEEAGLVADVVGGGELQVHAELFLVQREDLVAGEDGNGHKLRGKRKRKVNFDNYMRSDLKKLKVMVGALHIKYTRNLLLVSSITGTCRFIQLLAQRNARQPLHKWQIICDTLLRLI